MITEEQWWDEDADRLNALAEAARPFAAVVSMPTKKKADDKAWCPTGPGGGRDNSCPPNRGGSSAPSASRNDRLREQMRPEDTVYDAQALVDAGPPSEYEGGYWKEGQTIWDRYSFPSYNAGGKNDEVRLAESLQSLKDDPYSAESEARKAEIEAALPLRQQALELEAISTETLNIIPGQRRNIAYDPHTDAWVAEAYSSGVTNPLMVEMSRTTRTPDQQAELTRLLDMQPRINGEPSTHITQADVDRVTTLAQTTSLPEGVTLFHGMDGFDGRELLDQMSRTQGDMTINKLISTTIRPSIATSFGRTNEVYGSDHDFKTESGEMIHPDATLSSVLRIRGATKGLPLGAASHYKGETEVVLAPDTRLRFTGDSRIVFMAVANDSGWPSRTFRPRGAGWSDDKATRTLHPVKVFDVEVIE
jgi:hypothetical protein